MTEKIHVTTPCDTLEMHICSDPEGRPQLGIVLHEQDGEGDKPPPSMHFSLEDARSFHKMFAEGIEALAKMHN